MTNYIRAFLVLFFFGLLTACGGGGGTSASGMTMTMPDNPAPSEPVTLAFDAPELGALHYESRAERHWFVVVSVAAEGKNTVLFGRNIMVQRQSIFALTNSGITMPDLNRVVFNANGNLAPLIENGLTVTLPIFGVAVAFQTRPNITVIAELCPVTWLASYINDNLSRNACDIPGGLSYTPNMPNVLHAAMADTFHRGIAIGESNFAFSGRHNGNDRAAGFTYNFDTFALRTDYIRLPSKQDGEVMLDTYRFGIIRPINDEARFFAGVDSYKNAILALDVNGDNLHRFGIAAGDGYAVRYEFRVRL